VRWSYKEKGKVIPMRSIGGVMQEDMGVALSVLTRAWRASMQMHDIDDASASWLVAEAERRGVSVEIVAKRLLQQGLEWERRRAKLPSYHDLDTLAGTWSEDDAAAFFQAVADNERVDPSLWP
jgi:hypothetical protein